MSRSRKDGVFITHDMLIGMKIAMSGSGTPVDVLISELNNRAVHKQTSKSGGKGKDTYFLRPVQANDTVKAMMSRCIDRGTDVTLRHTHDLADGSIVTCQSDVKSLLSAYIKAEGLSTDGLIAMDDLLWSGLSDAYKEQLQHKGVLTVIGENLFIRKDRGTVGSLASELVR